MDSAALGLFFLAIRHIRMKSPFTFLTVKEVNNRCEALKYVAYSGFLNI